MPAFVRYVQDDTTAESIREQLANLPLALVVAIASFRPESNTLLKNVAALEEEYDSGSCCGPAPTKPNVLVIKIDEADELEELGESHVY